MLDLIKRLLAFLAPILKMAALETVSDIAYEAAYGRRPMRPIVRPRHYTNYQRYRSEFPPSRANLDEPEVAEGFSPWNGVMKVQFDLTAATEGQALAWLMKQMPDVGASDGPEGKVVLESWTVEDRDD